MIRILFLILWAIPVLGPQAQGAIEIYAHGHKYDSLQAYLASKKIVVGAARRAAPTDGALHQLYVLSVENGIVGALQDFYETRGPSAFQMIQRIYPEQLPEVIAQAVAASENPKLLISRPGKVRIMALTAQDRSNK